MIFYRFMRFFVVGYVRARVPGARRRTRARADDGRVRPRAVAPLDAGHPVRRRDHDPAHPVHGQGPLFRVPVLGAIFRALGGFPVERDGTDRGRCATRCASSQAGELLVVYPEGTRQHGREIPPLQPGAAYLAAKAGVPIVPVGIAGTEETSGRAAVALPGFGRVVVVVGEPIAAARARGLGRQAVRRRRAHRDTARTAAEAPRRGATPPRRRLNAAGT